MLLLLLLLLVTIKNELGHGQKFSVKRPPCETNPDLCFSGKTEPRDFSSSKMVKLDANNYSTTIKWNHPEQFKGSIHNYLVGIKKIKSPNPHKDIDLSRIFKKNVTEPLVNTHQILPLKPGCTYSVDVQAVDDTGFLSSGIYEIQVPDEEPKSAPNPIRVSTLNGESASLSWDPLPPDEMGGRIIKFEVVYYPRDFRADERIIPTENTNIELIHLSPNTTYNFKIRAVTSKGPGPWSSIQSFKTMKNNYFSPPIEIKANWVNRGLIKVTWQSPRTPKDRTTPDITGFRIWYAPVSDSTKFKVYECAKVYMATLKDLQHMNDEAIQIKIQSIGSNDNIGEQSDPIILAPYERGRASTLSGESEMIYNLGCSIYHSKEPDSLDKTFIIVSWETSLTLEEKHQPKLNYTGKRFYVNEDAQPREEDFPSRVVDLNPKQNSYIFNCEPNTMYDVLISIKSNLDHSFKFYPTSCRSAMRPPSKVPEPKFSSYDEVNKRITATVERVSERLGGIRIYYLLIAKPNIIADIEKSNKPANISELIFNKSAHLFADYQQSTFLDSHLSIQINVEEDEGKIRQKREIEDFTSYSNQKVNLYDVSLAKNYSYRAATIVCIYKDDYNQNSEIYFYKQADLCKSSNWTPTFRVSTEIQNTDSIVFENKPLNASTIIVATVIFIVLFLVSAFCIGCVLKQRLKKNKSDSIKLGNTLKIPLMKTNSINPSKNNDNDIDQNILENGNRGFVEPRQHDHFQPIPIQAEHNQLPNRLPHQIIPPMNDPCDLNYDDQLSSDVIERVAIPLDHLSKHVLALKANDNLGISQEFNEIQSQGNYTWHEANKEVNKYKNRYANVIAYDHTRVVLKVNNSATESDYINANFIDGYKRKNYYIATQGPLSNTFADFWRMVWEQNSRIIVMMTRLQERSRVKCDQYWPVKGSTTYPVFSTYQTESGPQSKIVSAYLVTIQEMIQHAYYVFRVFTLQKLRVEDGQIMPDIERGPNSEIREIKHYQFTAWPDYGAPIQAQPLLLFIRKVNQGRANILNVNSQKRMSRSSKTYSEIGPTIVHCSAGVGRTGAFIVIDSQLERLYQEKSVDVFGSVCKMRSQRNFMVQTEEQYIFLYDVLVEAVEVSGTEIPIDSLMNYIIRLRQPASTLMLNAYAESMNSSALIHQKCSALELEFKRLSLNLRAKDKFYTAQLHENQMKNRFANLIPYEENRVILGASRTSSDYINASFIDGYWRQKSYIATQTPNQNTIEDFWRMIWEQNSPIVVMLTKSSQNRDAVSSPQQYWPTERIVKFSNGISVEPIVEYNMQSFVLREFRLSDGRDGQSRTLRQFQFTGWPETDVAPKSAESLIDLIGQVHKTQAQFGQDGPITIHCSNGVGLTGVFLALSLVLDRLRAEGVVDLFLTCRLLRTQRMQLVQTLDQYSFCYSATLDYFSQFSTSSKKNSQQY